MSHWIEDNAVAIVGWIGTLILFAFVFGRRLSRLEATDTSLARSIDLLAQTQKDLSKTVENLSLNVNGHKGTAALAASLDKLGDAISACNSRITANEQRLELHEVQLAKLGEMRVYLANQFTTLAADLTEVKVTLNKLEIRAAILDGRKE